MPEPSWQYRGVKKIHKLRGNLAFQQKGNLFDIAILEVQFPFTLNSQVVPAKLPTAPAEIGSTVVVSGWGSILEGILVYLNLS